MTYDDTARKLAVKVIGTVESDLNYSAVNYNDPITVGIAQWYGTRAASVLCRMRDTNPSAWHGVAGSIANQLATISEDDSFWNSRYLTQAEGNSLTGTMSRNQEVQNAQLTDDLEPYKKTAMEYGFNPDTNTQVVIYFFSMHHQSPKSALEVVRTLDSKCTLEQIHAATLKHSVLGQYGSRYRTTYDLIKEGDVSGTEPTPEDVPEPEFPNGNSKYVERRGDLLVIHFADGEQLTCYPVGVERWMPGKSTPAPGEPAPTQPTPPPGAGGWFHPIPGAQITSPYGPRSFDGFHWGDDWSSTTAAIGRPVYAVTDLKITQAYNAGGGNATAGGCVKGHTLDGAYTFCYYHLAQGTVKAKVGDTIKAGAQIGMEGQTGNVTGTHLHFEAYEGIHNDPWPPPYGNPTEPRAILRAHGVSV